MTARVAAVRPREALVGHHGRRVDLEVLEAVGADEVTRGPKAAAGLGAPDVAADVVQPAETHAEDGAVLLRGDLPVRDAVGARRRGQEVLVAVLDPLHRDARELRGERDQRHVRIDERLDPEAPADVRRHDEPEPVLGQAEHACRERVHDERPHEVRPHRADAVEGVPARDDAVRLDRRGAVLRELEPLPHDDVGLAEGAVRVAVDEPPVVREVRTDGLVQDGRVRLERALGVHHGGQRLVPHLHEIGRVLGDVAALADDDGDGLADEARLVGRRTVVADGRGDAHCEGLGVLQDVLAREDADDPLERARGLHLVAKDAGVGVGRAHDRGVEEVRDRRMIVDVGAAAGEKPRVLDAPHRLADPALFRHARRTLVSAGVTCQAAGLSARRQRRRRP